MPEDKDLFLAEKEAARNHIKEQVAEYYRRFVKDEGEFEPGDRIPYSGRVFDEKEMENLVDSALDFWLTAGRFSLEFVKKFGEYVGAEYVSIVNSGSSANLLAFMALTSHELGDRRIKKGDEVITVACGFPTTVAPIMQYGAVPVFVDVTIPQYNIDVSRLEEALSDKTKAVMIAHTLGNPFDIATVKKFCKAHDLWLVEDTCDALGTEYTLDGKKGFAGTFGDIGTASFYPPHHITMGEGGAVFTNDPLLHRIVRSFRDWGRECVCPPGCDNYCGHRFDGQFGDLPVGYDHKYVYSHLGYNLKATDMQASIGCAQMDKLPEFTRARRKNWQHLRQLLSDLSDIFILPEVCPDSEPSWFGFVLTMKEEGVRNSVTSFLEKNNIQTRLLFSGNIIKHPCFKEYEEGRDYRVVGDLSATDKVMNDTFWIGVYPGLSGQKIEYMSEILHKAVRR
ncbi:MAG: lipopolysaccharide biosynthesis protein RfbH [Butyrivibrio sp.]|nr:lipopolysaccharide biosynthesis protein RfbH [Butyrivibrio sp.]